MAWFLLWIVQSLSVVALAALAGRLGAGRVRPAVQHVVWLCTLACVAGLGIVGLVPPGSTSVGGAAVVHAFATPSPAPLVVPAAPGWMAPFLFAIWMAGAVWLGARLWWQVSRVSRLKQSCVVMAGRTLRGHPVLRVASREGRRARFCWCDEAAGPAMLGFGRPIIAVPRGLADRLDDSDFERVLLHELAHVRRRDDWMALAGQILLALMWVNPAVHWAGRGLAVTREMACDDWVIDRTERPAAYARCLTAVAAMRVQSGRGRLAPAIVGSRRVLRRRVARAIDARRRPSARVSQVAVALAPALTGLVGVAILALSPIVFEEQVSVGAPGGVRPDASVPAPPPGAARVLQPRSSEATTIRAEPQRPENSRTGGADGHAMHRTSPPADRAGEPGGMAAPHVETTAVDRSVAASTLNELGGTEPTLLPPSEARQVGDVLLPPIPDEQPLSLTVDSDQPAWWSNASGAAGTVGSGAVSAGRATASFAKRLGGAISSPFAR